MPKTKRFKTWHEGQMRVMSEPHPYKLEASSTRAMKAAFLADPTKICPWCDRRNPNWSWQNIQVDHLVGMCYQGPRVVLCSRCNAKKRGRMPDQQQIYRIFHSDDVVRDRSKDDLNAWFAAKSKEIFGRSDREYVMIGKVRNKILRNVNGTPCEWGMDECVAAGYC